MSKRKPIWRVITIMHGKSSDQVYVYCLPDVKDFLRLRLSGTREPLLLQVRSVTHDINQDSGMQRVEVRVCRVRKPSLSIESCSHVPPPFQVILGWPPDAFVPRVGDSVRFRQDGAAIPDELKVSKVIHEIDHAGKTHSVQVQIFDASPRSVFCVEDFQALICEDLIPLEWPSPDSKQMDEEKE